MGHTAKRVTEADIEIGLGSDADPEEALQPRPPVVTIMGHVDHGKTSLLDALRSTDVAAHEAGGITQHIGAYQVTLEGGQKITFLDTPGHEAFTAMRARGAKVTDIVVLVVAADDGIMPQTIEAIAHAGRRGADDRRHQQDRQGRRRSGRVRQALLQHEVQVEEFGGDVRRSGLGSQEDHLDKLQEAILRRPRSRSQGQPRPRGRGTIVEAKLDPGRGSVATVLVQRGTLHGGDVFVAGAVWGRVRRLVDDRGQQVEAAPPAYPVEVLGLNGTPEAGDEFHVVDSEARAREIAEFRARRDRQAQLAKDAGGRGSLEEMLKGIREGTAKDLPVVIKADVQGSVEAIAASLQKLSTEKVAVRVLYSGVGGINESDVTLARASNAVIIGFNVRANPQARDVARRDKIEIRYYSIIYNVVDDVRALMTGLLDPTYKENFLGYAEIRQVFKITKVGNVAGCMITEGVVKRGAKVRLLRDDTVIHEGTLKTLKRFKDEVREVNTGFECGMAFENYEDIRPGDQIECFEVEEVRPTPVPGGTPDGVFGRPAVYWSLSRLSRTMAGPWTSRLSTLGAGAAAAKPHLADGERRQSLGARTTDLLLALLRARGDVVSQQQLMAAAWPGRGAVEQANLTVQISALRKAFGDAGAAIIITVPGRGYRFGGSLPRPDSVPAAPSAMASAGVGQGPSLVVLPFRILGGDADQAFFADGLVEDLITALSRVRWFTVIARASAFALRDRDVTPMAVGRELSVRYMISGAVRRANGRVRVNVGLIRTADGREVWSDRFDGADANIFALQDQIVPASSRPSSRTCGDPRSRSAPPDRPPGRLRSILAGDLAHAPDDARELRGGARLARPGNRARSDISPRACGRGLVPDVAGLTDVPEPREERSRRYSAGRSGPGPRRR